MFLSNPLRWLAILAVTSCLSSAALGGTILHTVDDQGYLDLALDYPSVGQFTWSDSQYNYSASGVLIAPNWVLTAAHVVDEASYLNFQIGGKTVPYDAVNWIAHPDWNGNVGKGHDIGLVQFSTALKDTSGTAITPATVWGGGSDLTLLPQPGVSVGFGLTGTGLTGADSKWPIVKRAGKNDIDEWYLPPGKPGRASHIFLSDFDDPIPHDPAVDNGNNFGGDGPIDLEYLIASGDSGGGVFVDFGDGEGPELVGIHSFGWGRLDGVANSDYDDVSGHTLVSAFGGWIDDVMNGTGGGGGGGNGKGGGPPDGKGPKGKDFYELTLVTAAVPEPATLSLLGLAALCLVVCRRRKRK